MQKGIRHSVATLACGVVMLVALWTSDSFGQTVPNATLLDMPTVDASPPDGPRVAILRPTLGEVVKGDSFPLAVQFVAGKHKLTLIELLVDNKLVGALDEKGITEYLNSQNRTRFRWDTTRLTDGIHKLTVRATDAQGLRNSMSVQVAVMNMTTDKMAPTVTFLQPRDNVLRERVEVVVQAKDDFGVKSVTVYIGNQNSVESTGLFILPKGTQLYRFFLETRRYSNGDYFLFAEAEDFEGNRSMSAPFRFKIANAGGRTEVLGSPSVVIKPEPPVPPSGSKQPIVPERPMIEADGPTATLQPSGTPPDQSSGLPQPDIQSPKMKPYALAPEPRVDPQITLHPPTFELRGSGEKPEISVTSPKQRRMVSRPDRERGAIAPSAQPNGANYLVSVQPDNNLQSSTPPTEQKAGRPNSRLRPTPPPDKPQVSTAHSASAPVGIEPVPPVIDTSPVTGSRIVTRPKSLPGASSIGSDPIAVGVLVVPPPNQIGVLMGRNEHLVSTPVRELPGDVVIKGVSPTEPYLVKRGDTLKGIAARYRLSVEMIQKANPRRRLTSLKPGRTIQLPRRLPIIIGGEILAKADEPVGALMMDSIAFAPFRHVFERVGGFVDWNGAERLVTGIRGNQNVQLRIGDRMAIINGEPVMLQTEPFILYGRTIIPIRFFEQSLNLYVHWDKENGQFVMLPK